MSPRRLDNSQASRGDEPAPQGADNLSAWLAEFRQALGDAVESLKSFSQQARGGPGNVAGTGAGLSGPLAPRGGLDLGAGVNEKSKRPDIPPGDGFIGSKLGGFVAAQAANLGTQMLGQAGSAEGATAAGAIRGAMAGFSVGGPAGGLIGAGVGAVTASATTQWGRDVELGKAFSSTFGRGYTRANPYISDEEALTRASYEATAAQQDTRAEQQESDRDFPGAAQSRKYARDVRGGAARKFDALDATRSAVERSLGDAARFVDPKALEGPAFKNYFEREYRRQENARKVHAAIEQMKHADPRDHEYGAAGGG